MRWLASVKHWAAVTEMDDGKVRELLGRYRPVGPPDELRERALAASPTQRTWPWAAAAAALLGVTLGVHAASNRAIANVVQLAPPLSVDALTAAMGGTENARMAAEMIVEEQRYREWLAGPAAITRTVEDELNRVK